MNKLTKKEKLINDFVDGNYITFDEVPVIAQIDRADTSCMVSVNTIFNPMSTYLSDNVNINQIVKYDKRSFILYMESLKRTFANRASFVLGNLLNYTNNSIIICINKDAGDFILPTVYGLMDIDSLLYKVLLDINTYIYLLSTDIYDNDTNELEEIYSMEFASYLMTRIVAFSNSDPTIVKNRYNKIYDIAVESSQKLSSIIRKFIYEEPFVKLYIQLLDMYSKVHGDIPTELKQV